MTLVEPAPTYWSVLCPPYHHLLQSAGATEGLVTTRELH